MSKRSPNSRISGDCGLPSQSRRSKKRLSRKGSVTGEPWYDHDRDSQEPSEDEVPGMEYTSMFWRQPRIPHVQPHLSPDGQRLFTAMSDPSVCGVTGYSAVPITYAMEPISLPPMYRLYQPVIRPANYRPTKGRTRSAMTTMHNETPCNNDSLGNGYSSLQENGWSSSRPMVYQNGDYASLPPTANADGKTGREALNSEHRRYSDPGLGPAAGSPDNCRGPDSDSSESGSSITTVGRNNKLFLSLVEEMTKMKETSSQLFKELHQAKSDLETVKTEISQLKQNVPLDYQPGMLTDIIREIRDASRAKEELTFASVRRLMESQESQKSADLEQLKGQLEALRADKREDEPRLEKLERDVEALRLSLDRKNREIAAFEEENLALRRELQEARARRAEDLQQQQQQPSSPSQPSPQQQQQPGRSKLEGLMKMLRKKTPQTPARPQEHPEESESADDDDDDDEDDEEEETTSSEDSSRNQSVGHSDNSMASGPVTDL